MKGFDAKRMKEGTVESKGDTRLTYSVTLRQHSAGRAVPPSPEPCLGGQSNTCVVEPLTTLALLTNRTRQAISTDDHQKPL